MVSLAEYCIILTNWDTRKTKNFVILLKFEHCGFTMQTDASTRCRPMQTDASTRCRPMRPQNADQCVHKMQTSASTRCRPMRPHDADQMANSVDLDQAAPFEGGSTLIRLLFLKGCLIWVCTVCPNTLRVITLSHRNH